MEEALPDEYQNTRNTLSSKKTTTHKQGVLNHIQQD